MSGKANIGPAKRRVLDPFDTMRANRLLAPPVPARGAQGLWNWSP